MLLEWNAMRNPDAVVLDDGFKSLSYRELALKVSRIQNVFECREQHGKVGLVGRNSAEMVAVLIALAGSCDDLTLIAPEMNEEELLGAVSRFQIDILVFDDQNPRLKFLQTLQKPSTNFHPFSSFQNLNSIGRTRRKHRRPVKLSILTSGSTGPPKAVGRKYSVMVLLQAASAIIEKLAPRAGESILFTPPIHHGFGLSGLGLALFFGGTVHLCDSKNGKELLERIVDAKIETLVAVPTVLFRIVQSVEQSSKTRSRFPNTIICGSAPLSQSLVERTHHAFGPVLYNLYGSSEAGVISVATPKDLEEFPDSVGFPIPGIEVCIGSNPENKLSEETIGEVLVKSEMGKGLKSEWQAVGDLGELNNGRLFLRGRKDDLLIIGGENVYPAMLEEIFRKISFVEDCLVLGIPDPEFGCAVHLDVVLKPNAPMDWLEQIFSAMEENLPKSKRPRRVVAVENLCENSVGKVLRKNPSIPTGHMDSEFPSS